jgi:GNAT superfamily N-acetyltransferase
MRRASFEHGVGVKDPHPLEERIDFLISKVVPFNTVRVARKAGDVVAFMASNSESVSQLFVRVESIGQGIGTRLLRLARAESSGGLRLFTFARNLRARGFCEHHGFAAIAHGFEPMWQLEDVKYQWVRNKSAA